MDGKYGISFILILNFYIHKAAAYDLRVLGVPICTTWYPGGPGRLLIPLLCLQLIISEHPAPTQEHSLQSVDVDVDDDRYGYGADYILT